MYKRIPDFDLVTYLNRGGLPAIYPSDDYVEELRAFLSYTRKNIKMCYWRSTSQFEVDLIPDSQWGFEIKSAISIQDKHLKGIRALKEEGNIQNFAAVSCDRYERKTQDNIAIFPWKLFLEKLWNGDII